MKFLVQNIANLDILFPEVKLKIQYGNSKYQNIYGGILSLLTMLLIFTAIVYFLIEFFTRQNTQLITTETISNKVTLESFDSIPLMIRMSDTFSLPLEEPEKYYRFFSNYRHYRVNETDPEKTMTQFGDWIDVERCDLNNPTHNPNFSFLFRDYVDISTYFCPNAKIHRDIIGTYGDSEPWSFYNFFLRKCDSDVDNIECAPQHEIDDFFRVVNHIILPLSTFPYSPFISGERVFVSDTFFKSIWMRMKTIYFTSDWGLLFEENEVQKFFIVDSITSEVDFRDTSTIEIPYTLFQLTILNSKSYTTYLRSYMKAQDFLVNVGGIIKGLTMISAALSYIICYRLYYHHLIYNSPDISNETTISFWNKNISLETKRKPIQITQNPEIIYKDKIIKVSNANNSNKGQESLASLANFLKSKRAISIKTNNFVNINENSNNPLKQKKLINETSQINNLNVSKNANEKEEKKTNTSCSKVQYILPKELEKISTLEIKLSYLYFLLPDFLYCCYNPKFSIYKKGYQKLNEELEITTLLNKLNQFEKLKDSILNKDQLLVFNFMFQTSKK